MWNVWWSIKNIFRQNKSYIGIRGLLICLVAANARDLKSEWDKVKKSIVLGNSFHKKTKHMDGLMQDCSTSIAKALEILQSTLSHRYITW